MNNEDPFVKFHSWHQDALSKEVKANAMTLATATNKGMPSLRTVALAEFNPEIGFVFYTDYDSQKGREIAENPHVALLFYWPNLYLQVRIEGVATKTSTQLSDKYFYQRAKEKQLSASLSHQSERIQGKDALLVRFQAAFAELRDKKIERPKNWGGYQVKPNRFEFWIGSEVRLHTRIVFELENQQWISYYLQP